MWRIVWQPGRCYGARAQAGITQRELARRAGVAQSVVSMYESGRRQPSVPMLVTLLRGAGFELGFGLLATPVNAGSLNDRLHRHRDDVIAAAEKHHVTVRGVFGSVARGEEREGSDVDLLLDVPEGVGLLSLARLEHELQAILGADVDLVPEAGLKPAVRQRVLADLIPL